MITATTLRHCRPWGKAAESAAEARGPRQGLRRQARGRRRQPDRPRRQHLPASSAPTAPARPPRLRMLLGIIDPIVGQPQRCSATTGRSRRRTQVGYLPEERGLYPAMTAREAIAFMGALRGLPIARGPAPRRSNCSTEHGLGDWAKKPIRTLSKGMAQTVQLLGTIVHEPRLIVLDEPFSGLDAINQEKLEQLIRDQAADGVTVIFSTHVIAHAERLCERIAIIAEGKVAFEGAVDEARGRLRPIVHLRTRAEDGAVAHRRFPPAPSEGGEWRFELPASGPEPLLKALIDGGAGIETLSIERPGLHDAFVAIAGEAAAREMGHVPRRRKRHEAARDASAPPSSSPAAISPRRCSARPSSSSCSGRCSRSCSARASAASARRSSRTPSRRPSRSSPRTEDFAAAAAAARAAVAAGRRAPLVELRHVQARAPTSPRSADAPARPTRPAGARRARRRACRPASHRRGARGRPDGAADRTVHRRGAANRASSHRLRARRFDVTLTNSTSGLDRFRPRA